MMMLSEIASAVGGRMLGADVLCQSVGSDSRNIAKNQLFVAIKGDKFDGNAFAQEAIQQGAAAVLVSDANTQASPAVLVKDTRLSLGQLASHWRNKFDMGLAAITGSNGKTTAKEMLAAILVAASGDSKKVLATQGNLNNDIGVPMTLFNLRQHHQYAVVEMGMNHLGEIEYLTNIAQPKVAVITNAGTAHIGELGSRDNIAKAKGEIYAGLAPDGIAVINADDAYCDYWMSLNSDRKMLTFGLNKADDVSASFVEKNGATDIRLTTPSGSESFTLNMLGKHNVINALAASACAVALGVSNQAIVQGLSQILAVKGRLQRKVGINGALLIDDTYNANPDSMKAAIDVLASQTGSTIFVMGDMAELGESAPQMHADIGAYAKQKNIAQFFALGNLTREAAISFGANAQHFADIDVLVACLKAAMQAGVTVLVKGSRFMQMERVVQAIAEKTIEKTIEKNIEQGST